MLFFKRFVSYRTAILPHDFRKPAILLCAKLQQVSKPPRWITAIKIKLQSLKCVIQLEGREPLCFCTLDSTWPFSNPLILCRFYRGLKPNSVNQEDREQSQHREKVSHLACSKEPFIWQTWAQQSHPTTKQGGKDRRDSAATGFIITHVWFQHDIKSWTTNESICRLWDPSCHLSVLYALLSFRMNPARWGKHHVLAWNAVFVQHRRELWSHVCSLVSCKDVTAISSTFSSTVSSTSWCESM